MVVSIDLYGALTTPLLLSYAAAVAFCLGTARHAWAHRERPGVRWFAVWLASSAAWVGLKACSLLVADPGRRLLVESLALAAVPASATAWLLFALGYAGRGHLATDRVVRWLWAGAALAAALIATNPGHGLVFHIDAPVRVDALWAVASFSPQVGYWALHAYLYLLFLAGIGLLVDLLLDGGRLYADQTIAVVGAITITLASALVVMAGRSPVPVDVTPLAFAVGSLPLAYAVFRSDLLGALPAFSRLGERKAVETLDEGVLVLDPEDRVAVANPAAASLLGTAREAVLGRPVEEVLAASPLSAAPDWVEASADPALIADGRGASVPSAVRDGSTGKTYAVSRSCIGDGARTLVFRDVTDERRRKQRLLVLNRVLRHNLRNEMNVLLGHLELIEGRPADREHVAVVEEVARDLVGVGEKAREVDRIVRDAAGDPGPVDLAAVARAAADRYATAPATLAVDAPDDAWIEARGPVVRAAIENLVENAVEHGSTSPGSSEARQDAAGANSGEPSVADAPEDAVEHGTQAPRGDDAAPGRRVGDGGDPADVRVTVEREDDAVTVAVEDGGPGIPPQELRTVREGEVTDLRHGSGLGLWLVRWCAEAADADLAFEVDGGTRATMRFPAHRAPD